MSEQSSEFDKFWDEDGTIIIGNDDNLIALAGWKAGLKWSLEQVKLYQYYTVVNVIEEELGD